MLNRLKSKHEFIGRLTSLFLLGLMLAFSAEFLYPAETGILKLRLILHNKSIGHPYQLSRIIKVYTGSSSDSIGKLKITRKAKGIRIYQGTLEIPEGDYKSLYMKYKVGYYRRKRIIYGKIFKKEFSIRNNSATKVNIAYHISEDSEIIDKAFLDKKLDVQKLNDPFYTGQSTKSRYKKGWRMRLSNTKF